MTDDSSPLPSISMCFTGLRTNPHMEYFVHLSKPAVYSNDIAADLRQELVRGDVAYLD